MSFDPSKPVQTRDGRPARIICTDLKNNDGYSLVALVFNDFDKDEQMYYYDSNGKNPFVPLMGTDLINIPTVRSGWINIYDNNSVVFGGEIFNNKEDAMSAAILMKSYKTTIQIEWEE